MKNLILFTPIFFILISCGPSQNEKEEIAILTCNIMGESRNMDAAIRLREINVAREQIGEEKYLSTDYEIKEAFKYGLCKELVLNNDYQNKLLEAKNIEKAIEELAEETRRQELAEIEADKAAKEENRKEMQEKWRTAIVSHLKKVKINNALKKITLQKLESGWRWVFSVSCDEKVYGFNVGIRIILKDNMGTFTSKKLENGDNNCQSGTNDKEMLFRFYAWQFVDKPSLVEKLNDAYKHEYDSDYFMNRDVGYLDEDKYADEFIQEINLLITGVSKEQPKDFTFIMPAEYGDTLDEPYVLKKLR